MSDQPVPVYVDTRRVFQQGAEISGFMDLARLPRFRQMLASDKAAIHVQLEFTIGDRGYRVIHGQVQAEVEVACQRCLEPVAIHIDEELALALVKDDAEAAALRADLDPWIGPDIKLQLADLVEEQLMLSMPIVSYHAPGQCAQPAFAAAPTQSQDDAQDTAGTNPFAVLEKLKQDN